MYNRDMESSVGSFASKHSGDARTPILWALLALCYLFEIGAIAALINLDGEWRNYTALAAMIFPLVAMGAIVAMRIFCEGVFYTSPRQIADSFGAIGAVVPGNELVRTADIAEDNR